MKKVCSKSCSNFEMCTRKNAVIVAQRELIGIADELYAHVKKCILNAAFGFKVSPEDDAKHKTLLEQRAAARFNMAELEDSNG